jgi:peptidoglycan/LPS O-acetylase OafA/YrhL
MSPQQSRVFGLDAMRCLAISLVVLGHGSAFLTTRPLAQLRGFLWEHAFLGVEVFFVLSGFLIGSILLKVTERELSFGAIRDFWVRRWFRTLPNYYLFLIINIVGFALLKPDFAFDWKYLLFLQNFAWINERFFSVSWSLAVEEWFYLLLPLCVFVGALFVKDRKRAVLYSLLSFLAVIIVIRFFYVLRTDPKWNGVIRLGVLFRLDSLLFGVLAAYWQRYGLASFLKARHIGLLIGFLAVVIALVLKDSGYANGSVLVRTFLLPMVSVGFALFLPFCSTLSWPKGLLERGVRNISLWSYSLYLVHVAALEIFLVLRAKLKISGSLLVDGTLFVLWMIACVVASAIIYRYFEKPMTDLRDSVTRSRVSTDQLSSSVAINRSVP